MRVVLANASLIGCVNPEPTADATVIVEDGRIAETPRCSQRAGK